MPMALHQRLFAACTIMMAADSLLVRLTKQVLPRELAVFIARSVWIMVPGITYLLYRQMVAGALGLGPIRRKPIPHKERTVGDDSVSTDPPLVQRYSSIKTYQTTSFVYPDIRVFYRRHQQAEKLPRQPAPVPLLVFIHGLGGSVAQFNALLTSLTPIASCLAVDLPGCGRSAFVRREWEAYTPDALAELLRVVIEDHREPETPEGQRQPVVLVAHSMGCSLAALLANPRDAAIPDDSDDLPHGLVGLVAICPLADPPSPDRALAIRRLLQTPEFVFHLWRLWDRRGGLESASVRRFVGPEADVESKKLQYISNKRTRTGVLRRMAAGMLPDFITRHGLPGRETWTGLDIPVLLVGGEDDHVTPPRNVYEIAGYLGAAVSDIKDAGAEAVVDRVTRTGESYENASTFNERLPAIPPQPLRPKKTVVTRVLAKPANHALLYMTATSRVLAGLTSDFLESHVTGRLSLGWQLQYLCREGKWDVKNLEKWKRVTPVSGPIRKTFRAIKTLRELDPTHCPEAFAERWGPSVKDVVDISHDTPVYNPQGLESRGIRYHKFPTVSKSAPTDKDVGGFLALVDRIRAQQQERAEAKEPGNWPAAPEIGVHCHYGFNRTGFLIVCYLVERCHFLVQDAIDLFAEARPNGIKHEHFKDRLHLKYAPGWERERNEWNVR